MRNAIYILAGLLLTSFIRGDKDIYLRDISSHFTDWFAHNKKNKPDFSLEYFTKREVKNSSYEFDYPAEDEPPDPVQSKMFIWSPDSTRWLDIYSYSYWFNVDSNRVYIEGQELECAVFLNPGSGDKGYRITYGGSGTDFEDAAWFSSDCFAVAGSEYCGNDYDSVYNFVKVVDMKKNTTVSYSGEHYKYSLKRNSFVQEKAERVLLGK